MKKIFPLLLAALFPLLSLAQSIPTTPTTPLPYLDPSLPLDTRVNDLVSRLTIDEKISQMQDVAPAIPRLQIPAYNWWNEGLHGVARSSIATVFPQAIGLAATWDTTLLHDVAGVISTEARAKYNDARAHNNTSRYYGLTFWSPNINIFRDPRWGRGQETYGEDPFLTGRLGVAFVTGLQGDDPHYLKAISTPKHYAVHSGPELLRHRMDVPVSLHDLYDTYTPAFRAAVVDGHADSIMCAYNSVLTEPACANHLLLDLLRNTWGFKGYVVSDCWAISDLYQGHDYVMSLSQAAALAVKAGTDLSCGPQYKSLDYALEDRLLTPQDIDRAVHRLFEARFRLGMFDPPPNVPWSKLTLADVDTPDNRKLALEAARESIVLLKNDRKPHAKRGELTLPLDPNIKSIAVVGPTADSLDALLGNYNGTPSAYSTILAGLRKRYPNAKINYAVGAPITETRPVPVPTSALRTSVPGSAGILPASGSSGAPGVSLPRALSTTGVASGLLGSSQISETQILENMSFRGPHLPEEPAFSPSDTTSSVTAPGVGASAPTLIPVTYWAGVDPGLQPRARSAPEESPSHPQTPASQLGLTADYFSNRTLTGTPTFTRIDPNVDFEWNNVSPAPSVPAENFSVRWIGELLPPIDGDYRVGASSDGGYRLYLDNKLLIDDWAPHGERAMTTLIHLQAGRYYPIKLEYYHQSWESAVHLIWLPPNLEQEAVDAARNSGVTIAVVGITAQLEGEESSNSDPGFFGGDRTDITLPAPQEQLLQAVAATGKPLVVVLTSGSALAVNWANDHAAAILEAWYPGEEGGTAVADVLSGDYNPAGRLPVTFYKSVAQLPPFTSYNMANRTYRYFNEPPLYPFGFGLSYSTFSYSDFAITDLQPSGPIESVRRANSPNSSGGPSSLSEIGGNSPVYVSVRVTNSSSIPGDEVVQLYLSHPSVEGAPLRALVDFRRIHLAAGGFQVVSFVLSPRELSIVDPTGHRVVPTGPVELWLGSSQPITLPNRPAPSGVSAKFTITTTATLPN